jgi:phenylpyruvate tautomerase PptA (4-oxalocrotonate tautomerase family)
MPLVDVLCPRNTLSEAQRASLAEELTRVALGAEGLPDNAASRAIAVVTFREADAVFVGGRPDERARFAVFLYALAGALAPEARREVHGRVRDAFQRACPELLVRGGANAWSMVNEIEEGDFGVAGAPVSIELVRSLVARTP